jgi:hypothetical protein
MIRERRLAACAVVCFMVGCAGNGEGLDENGRPVGSGGDDEPLTANLQSIQDQVFTPICTQCHTGASAPVGLRLDQDSAFAMLVNAPSTEQPALNRVTPGDPDGSYLIQKLEGTAAVGGQMPLGQPALPEATIAVIRQWIANGAPAASSGPPAVVPMQLHAISSSAGSAILVQADGELNVSTLTVDTVRLIRSGGDGTFDDGNEINVAAHIDVRSLDPTVLAIRAEQNLWVADAYRLTISSQGASAVRDRDGLPVNDFAMQFNIGGSL